MSEAHSGLTLAGLTRCWHVAVRQLWGWGMSSDHTGGLSCASAVVMGISPETLGRDLYPLDEE
jgi:hypothetical protein